MIEVTDSTITTPGGAVYPFVEIPYFGFGVANRFATDLPAARVLTTEYAIPPGGREIVRLLADDFKPGQTVHVDLDRSTATGGAIDVAGVTVKPGCAVVEIVNAADADELRGRLAIIYAIEQ